MLGLRYHLINIFLFSYCFYFIFSFYRCDTLAISPIKKSPTPPKIRLNDVTLTAHDRLASVQCYKLINTPALSSSSPTPVSTVKKIERQPTSQIRPVTRSANQQYFPKICLAKSSDDECLTQQVNNFSTKSGNQISSDANVQPISSANKKSDKRTNRIDVYSNRAFELRLRHSPVATSTHHDCQLNNVENEQGSKVRRPITRFFKKLTNDGGRKKSIALKRLSNARRISAGRVIKKK